MKSAALLTLIIALSEARACDLCAVYQAADARGESGEGLALSISGQFIPYRTTQLDGEEIKPPNADYLESSITHFVVGYNFHSRFGLSLNVPLTIWISNAAMCDIL